MTIQTRTTDEERFYKTDDGEEVPSVTTILSVIDKSGPLIPWAVKTTCDYIEQKVKDVARIAVADVDELAILEIIERARKEATRVKEEAGDIGTAVHAVIQDWAESTINGQPFFAHFTDPRMQTAWEAFEKFAEATALKPLSSELKLVHPKQKYGGQVDLIAGIAGKRYLVDIKSSNHFLEIPYGPQVAAYESMLPHGVKEWKVDGIAVLRLDKKTGIPDFHDMTEKRKQYLEVFKAAHKLWIGLREARGRKKVKK